MFLFCIADKTTRVQSEPTENDRREHSSNTEQVVLRILRRDNAEEESIDNEDKAPDLDSGRPDGYAVVQFQENEYKGDHVQEARNNERSRHVRYMQDDVPKSENRRY
jgi:hypothetical protein